MKAINNKAVKFLKAIRDRAEKNGIRATKAVEMMIQHFPDLTRAETYNSAAEVGINKLTARNVYDRLKASEESSVTIKDRRNGDRRAS